MCGIVLCALSRGTPRRGSERGRAWGFPIDARVFFDRPSPPPLTQNAAEIFLRKARAAGSAALAGSPAAATGGADAVAAAPPLISVDGVHYLRATHAGLHFVATTRANASPALALELLARVAATLADACGGLSEAGVRRNAVLVYELLDEVVDGGLPQPADAAALRERIVSTPVIVSKSAFGGGRGGAGAAAAAAAAPVTKSVLADAASTPGAPRRDEVFVDIVERVSAVLVAGCGGARALRARVDGALRVKAFLSGAPAVSVALSENLIIGRDAGGGGGGFGGGSGGIVRLDDALFHEAASLARFDADRAIDLASLPDGETDVLRYRASAGVALPFSVAAARISDGEGGGRAELSLTLTADYAPDKTAAGWTLTLPLPPAVARVAADVASTGGAASSSRRGGVGRGALAPPPDRPGAAPSAGTADYDEAARVLTWRVPAVPGGTTLMLRARITLAQCVPTLTSAARRGIGPATLAFSVPQLSVTGLAVRYFHVAPPGGVGPGSGSMLSGGGRGGAPAPHRWVRYVTTASAYEVRFA